MAHTKINVLDLISDKQRKLEIIAVVLTGLGKFLFMDFLQWKFLFITLSIVSWTTYVIYQSNRVDGILKYWGFRRDNFGAVMFRILPFGIVFVLMFFIVGFQRDTLIITWHIVPVFILYPVWGVIQQFLVVGLVAGNLQDLQKNRLSKFIIVVLTAILFGLLHYPYYWLMIGTFVLALLYGFIYLRSRNVYAMGLFHGWLGGLFFYTIVGRDPFAEVFGNFL